MFLTSDATWDPSILDNEFGEEFHDAIMEDPEVTERRDNRDPRVDDHGILRSRADYELLFRAQDDFIAQNATTQVSDRDYFFDATATGITYIDTLGEELPYTGDVQVQRQINAICRLAEHPLTAMPNRLRRLFPALDSLKPYFGWASNEKIKTMLDKTSQHYRGVVHYPFRKHFKSRFPAANVPRLNEWQATDTFFSDVPAADDGIPGHGGCTMLQVFLGLTSGAVHGYPMTTEKQVPQALEDHIRKVGAPIGLLRTRRFRVLRPQWQHRWPIY